MTMAENRQKTGREYEGAAAEYLSGCGCRILERNFCSRYGEIDIIAEDSGVLVFVEVKFRARGGGQEAVDANKQRRICRTALFYYTRYGYGEDTPCRFDVIAIDGRERMEHIKDAFDLRW